MSAHKLKVVRAITDLPPACYRLSTDGRKWKSLCEARQKLANWLALKGNPDGTQIFPSVAKMISSTGWSHGKVCYVLDDLKTIGCIINEQKRRKERGAFIRRFDPALLLAAHASIKRGEAFAHRDTRVQDSVQSGKATIQHSPDPQSKIDGPTVQDTEPQSKIEELQSNAGLDTTVLSDRPYIPTTPTEGKKSEAAVSYFSECYGQVTGGKPLPIPLTKEEENQMQSLEERYGKRLYGKVCRYWTQNRAVAGLNQVGSFFLKEFDEYLSIVRAQGKPNPQIQAAMDAARAQRQQEIDEDLKRIREQQEYDKASLLEI